MNDAWGAAGLWLLRMAVGGGVLLFGAWALMRWTRQPARQQRLGEWGMTAALLLAVLSLAPAWLIVTLPWEVPVPSPAQGPGVLSVAHLPSLAAPENDPPGDPLVVYEPGKTEPDAAPQVAGSAWISGSTREDPAGSLESPAAAGAVAMVHDSAADPSDPGETVAWTSSLGAAVDWLTVSWQREGPRILAGIIGLWAVGALLLAARWLIGYCGLWRLLRRTEPAPAWLVQLLGEMTTAKRPPRLLISHRLQVPLSCGLFQPTIVLPAALCRTADAATLRWVLAHELTHLERRDPRSTLLFALGQTIYYFIPWYWSLRRQVRLCQEYIADAAAVAQHRQPVEYAQFLLTLTTAPALPAGANGVSGQSSDLFRRVTMLLQASAPVERGCPRLCSLLMAAGLLALAVLVSGLGLRADAAPSPEEDALPPAAIAEPAAPKQGEPAQEEKKDEPKKDEPAPKPPRGPGLDLPDFEELLKRLAQGMNPQQVEQVRKELEKARDDYRKALDRAREDMRKAIEQSKANPNNIDVRIVRPSREDERRLGARLDRPSDILLEQLNLPKGMGLVVEQVQAESAAAKAGLKVNDILLEVNGKQVSSDTREFGKLLDEIKANTPVDGVVLRKGKKEEIKGLSLPETKPTRRPVPRIQFRLTP